MTDPMNASNDDAWVDALLEKNLGHGPHIDDAGFTNGVTARLQSKKRRRFGRREVVVVSSSIVAAACGLVGLSRLGPLDLSTYAVVAHPAQALALVVVVGLALWGALASAEA
jgi:hypothetical protein